jgi:hypothetical protein
MSDITPKRDMMELQFDTYNLKAEESLPTFLNYLDTTQFTQNPKKWLFAF